MELGFTGFKQQLSLCNNTFLSNTQYFENYLGLGWPINCDIAFLLVYGLKKVSLRMGL